MGGSVWVVRRGVLAYAKQTCMNLGGKCLLAIVAASIQGGLSKQWLGQGADRTSTCPPSVPDLKVRLESKCM
jgi:hypothetical protein